MRRARQVCWRLSAPTVDFSDEKPTASGGGNTCNGIHRILVQLFRCSSLRTGEIYYNNVNEYRLSRSHIR